MAKDKSEKQPTAPILPHPASATHMALPNDLMQELITAAAVKYSWAELDPMMSKVKMQMRAMRVGEGGEVSLIQQPSP